MNLVHRLLPIAGAAALFASLISPGIAAAETTSSSKLFRGVWVRPEASPTSVTIQLDNMQKAGYNAVYVETFYHGFTIFPSEYVPIRPEMKGTDYLKLYVEEGRKRGLEIHPWTEVFYWEVNTKDYPKFPKTTLFDKHPEWKALLRSGDTTDKVEKAHIFANPAHPEVQAFLVKYFEEILTKYDVGGLNLDYIRYPDGPPDAGYDEWTRAAYKKETGIDPMDIKLEKDDPQWRAWVEWREQKIVKFVGDVKAMQKRVKPTAKLSAAVFSAGPEYRYTGARFQNWEEMVRLGYLDVVIPMAYHEKLEGIEEALVRIDKTIGEAAAELVPALAIQRKAIDEFSGTNHPPMIEQEGVIRKLGLPGYSVFCYEWMMDSDEGLNLFKSTTVKK